MDSPKKCSKCYAPVRPMPPDGDVRYDAPKPLSSGWQSIETAPLDFNRYLFITDKGVMRVDCYMKGEQTPKPGKPRWQEAPVRPYTHWMPLPKPPLSKIEGEIICMTD